LGDPKEGLLSYKDYRITRQSFTNSSDLSLPLTAVNKCPLYKCHSLYLTRVSCYFVVLLFNIATPNLTVRILPTPHSSLHSYLVIYNSSLQQDSSEPIGAQRPTTTHPSYTAAVLPEDVLAFQIV